MLLISNKLRGYLGLLKKGDYLVIGADNLKVYRKKLYMIIVPANCSKNINKVSMNVASKYDVPIIELSVDDLGESIGMNSCKILGVRNKGFCDAILANCKDEYKMLRGE